MFNPAILILDEPTVGLDSLAVSQFKKLVLSSAREGKTVLLVTHMISEIEQLVEEMIFLLEGKIRFSGPLTSVKQEGHSQNLEDAVVNLIKKSPNS